MSTVERAQAVPARRHDLDALRAVAMLLGIALHASMSFIPGAWIVTDRNTSPGFALFLAAIHGFRMPLFFVISGYFTMMLYRKRGLQALVQHRFLRIFLPLLLGMFTIIPATWIVSGIAMRPSAKATTRTSATASQSILQAAGVGDVEHLKSLIAAGADVNERSADGATPLLVAAFLGRTDAVKLLLENGADPGIANQRGELPRDTLQAPWGTTEYIANLMQVDVDRRAVMSGRRKIAAMLPQVETGSAAESGRATAQPIFGGLLAALFTIPLFGHLWFLWFLCWLVAGFVICITLGRALNVKPPPVWLTNSAVCYVWLIPLTMLPQSMMGQGALNFGPDTSIGPLPIPAVLAYYAIFFGFGAIYYDGMQRAHVSTAKIGSRWWIALIVSLVLLFPLGIVLAQQPTGWGRFLSVFLQAAYAWLMTFGLIGAFQRFLSRESRWMRYVSDSSYWLYLAHIPLLIGLQFAVRDFPIPAVVKFIGICIVTSGLLLLSYEWFVRYTPIGTLLNGKRYRGEAQPPVVAACEASVPPVAVPHARLHRESSNMPIDHETTWAD